MNPISPIGIIETILIFGAAQGIVLSIIIMSIQRGNRLANRILSLMLTTFSSGIILSVLGNAGYFIRFPHNTNIVGLLFLLLGPALYFYVKVQTTNTFKFRSSDLIHALPFLLLSFIYTLTRLLFSELNPRFAHSILSFVLFTITLFYLISSIYLLIIHGKNIETTFSSIEKINLRWLRLLIIIFLLTWITAVFFELLKDNPKTWNYVWLIISSIMYLIAYFGITQPEIFSRNIVNDTESVISEQKYKKSTLSPDKAEEYYQKLTTYMLNEKPYLQNEITLPDLAKKLSISTHHLSQIINEKLNQNFFEYINRHRIEEAKKFLSDPNNHNLNIASIGFDAGFNSVSAFNTAFKKYVKMTPSEFRKNIIASNQ